METETIVKKIIDRIIAAKNTGSNTNIIRIDDILTLEIDSRGLKCLVNRSNVLECSKSDFSYDLIIETLRVKRLSEKNEALKLLY